MSTGQLNFVQLTVWAIKFVKFSLFNGLLFTERVTTDCRAIPHPRFYTTVNHFSVQVKLRSKCHENSGNRYRPLECLVGRVSFVCLFTRHKMEPSPGGIDGIVNEVDDLAAAAAPTDCKEREGRYTAYMRAAPNMAAHRHRNIGKGGQGPCIIKVILL